MIYTCIVCVHVMVLLIVCIIIHVPTILSLLPLSLLPLSLPSSLSLLPLSLPSSLSFLPLSLSSLSLFLPSFSLFSVTDSQVRRLSLIKLPLLFSTLVLFVGWVKDGLYDFSSLPLALKVHLQETDCTTLKQLPTKYPENDTNLLAELKSLVDVLLHTEPHFVKEVNNIAHVS